MKTLDTTGLTYLATWGLFLVGGALAARFWDRWRTAVLVLCLLAVSGLAVRTWVRVPDWKTQTTLFETAVRDQPESFRVWTGLGEALLRDGRFQESIPCFEQSAGIHPGYANNWSLWLSGLIELDQWDEVTRVLPGLRLLRPEDLIGYYAQAQLHLRNGEVAQGLAEAEEGHRRYPDHGPLARTLAEALVSSGQDARAIEIYQTLLDSPLAEAVRERVAFLQQRNERWAEAEASYTALYEKHADWYNANALAWCKRGRALAATDSTEATRLWQEALELSGRAEELALGTNRRYARDTRAQILEARAEPAQALSIYRELMAAFPEHDEYRVEFERLRRAEGVPGSGGK